MGSALRRCRPSRRDSILKARGSLREPSSQRACLLGWGVALGPSMKESDMLLSRAEKLRRDARRVRSEATRLSDAGDRQRLMDVANNLETDARDLEARARRGGTPARD